MPLNPVIVEYLRNNKSHVTTEELTALDRDGYAVLRRTPQFWRERGIDIDATTDRIEQLIELEGDFGGREGKDYLIKANKVAEAGARRLANLVEKDAIFRKMMMVPDFLVCARHVLGNEFRLSSFTMREPRAGDGQQELHLDWQQRPSLDDPFASIGAYVYLDDMTLDNGPLRVLPGSHVNQIDIKYGSSKAPDPRIKALDAHSVRVQARRGDVVILNVQAFHAGTKNESGARRRVLFINYRNSRLRQQQNPNTLLSDQTKAALSDAEKVLMGVGRQSLRDRARDFVFVNRGRPSIKLVMAARAKVLSLLR